MKILLAQINSVELAQLQNYLSGFGHESLTTSSVKNSIKFLKSVSSIELVIADFVLKDDSGIEILKYCNQLPGYRSCPVILTSDAWDDYRVKKCGLFGVSELMTKPYTEDILAAKIESALDKRKRKVLLVEDDQEVIDSLADVLESENYEVLTAKSTEQALSLLSDNMVHLIVSDIQLPRMSGYELLAIIKSRIPDVPVILITGNPENFKKMDAYRLGASGILIKPFKIEELIYTLKNINQPVA
jgi:CheY-like chemotaxis protein